MYVYIHMCTYKYLARSEKGIISLGYVGKFYPDAASRIIGLMFLEDPKNKTFYSCIHI